MSKNKIYLLSGMLLTTLSFITYTLAQDNEVERLEKQYFTISEALSPLYQELEELQNNIKHEEGKLKYAQCLLAHAKKQRGMEVSQDSQYCFSLHQ